MTIMLQHAEPSEAEGGTSRKFRPSIARANAPFSRARKVRAVALYRQLTPVPNPYGISTFTLKKLYLDSSPSITSLQVFRSVLPITR